MRIEITRSGGFAGVRLHVVVDSAALPEAERRSLEATIEQVGFFALPARLASGTPDMHQYDVTIEREGAQHRVRVDEDAAPEALRGLLRRLVERARGE